MPLCVRLASDISGRFDYHQDGATVWAEYAGGRGAIVRGHLVGTRTGTGWSCATCS